MNKDPRDQMRHNINKRLRDNGLNGFVGGKVVNMCIDEAYKLWPKRRSNAQNRYIHGVVCKILGEFSGKKPAHVYNDLKLMFNPKVEERMDGSMHVVGGSIADLSTKKFSEVIERVQAWAAGKGCYIPDPNEEIMISAELEAQQTTSR